MPIYEYRCENGHNFEVMQAMSDDPIVACEVCGAPVERVFHPVAVHFKGSGFYTTDYAGKSKAAAGTDGDSASTDSGSGDSGSGDSGSGDSKSESKKNGGGDAKAAAGSSSD